MNTELITKLAEMAKVTDVDGFTKALESETDTEFKLDAEISTFSKTELEAMKNTIATNVGESVKKKAFNDAFEIQIKNMKKETGLEFDGKKSSDFINAFKSKILEDAKIEPNEKLSEMETSITNLQNKIIEKDDDYSRLQHEVTKNKLKFDVKSFIPNIPDSLGISKDDAANLFFLSRDIKDDGIYKDGNVLKSDLEVPLTLKESVDSFITEKGWIIKPAGRGGGSGAASNGSVPKTMEDFEAMLSKKGLEVASAEANALLQEIAKKNPEILD